MEFVTFLNCSSLSLCDVSKVPYMVTFVKGFYSDSPFISALIPINTLNTRCIILPDESIMSVLVRSCRAKIAPAVVVANVILVINFEVRPITFHQEPRPTLSSGINVTAFYVTITVWFHTTCNITWFDFPMLRCFDPRKNPVRGS